jgi:hypothetical protein
MHPLKTNMHLATAAAAAARAQGGLILQDEEEQLQYADMLIDVSMNCNSAQCHVIQDIDDNISTLGFETSPVFIQLPRNESLGIMNDGQSICSAMRLCTSTQQQSLARGTQNHVFMENSNKYCCIGAQPERAKRGVLSGLYRLKMVFQATNGIIYISFSNARSMLLTSLWTQTSFNISHVQD